MSVRGRDSSGGIPDTTAPDEDRKKAKVRKRKCLWCLGFGFVILAAIAALLTVIFIFVVRKNDDNQIIPYITKLECAVTLDDVDKCTGAGCLWDFSSDPNVPDCLLPEEDKFGFQMLNYDVGSLSAFLSVAKGSFFGDDFTTVRLEVKELNENVVRIRFLDNNTARYEVPVDFNIQPSDVDQGQKAYDVKLVNDPEQPFYIKVIRKADSTVLFDSSVGSLFLSERHIEVTTSLPSRNVYGIGENSHKTFRHDLDNFNKWPVFSRDTPPDPWRGAGRYNLYGVHPYYMCLEDSGKSHGVLFLNSNAMEFTLTPMPALNFRSSGGILDMFFFVGDNPEHVTQLYTGVIGRPFLPPYWGMGFQLSRYGYNSLDNMASAINRTRNQGFPLDVFYADIDVMNGRKDFTSDNTRFPSFNVFVNSQKKSGLRFIPIIDPGLIGNDSSYKPYQDGLNKNVYITWPDSIPEANRSYPTDSEDLSHEVMFGWVWPQGPVAFPDFFKTGTNDWWEQTIADFRQQLNFDGLWIDMNEPCTIGNSENRPEHWELSCPVNEYDDPNTFEMAANTVYSPNARLSDKTLCMAGVQGENGQYVHYNVHSLYGWSETVSTYSALKNTAQDGQVPLVISRSTYPSSGRYGTHWLGDNLSTWDSMRSSIVGILEFNLFGIPYVGADICGFGMNTTSELCGRWMQLGAFYPFSRNHNDIHSIDQDPGSDILQGKDRERALDAMTTRYRLLPYLHTLHYLAHVNGNTVVRALFHEFPTDKATYGIQEQFMWGPSLLISPVLYENATSLHLYLPDDVWYDFYKGIKVEPGQDRIFSAEDIERVALHVRAGTILPLKEQGAKNTDESRDKKFEIYIYPTKEGTAKGDLYWMAKKTKDPDEPNSFCLYHFELKKNNLNITLMSSTSCTDEEKQTIGKITLYDQDASPQAIGCQGTDGSSSSIPASYNHDPTYKSVTISLEIPLYMNGIQSYFCQWFQ